MAAGLTERADRRAALVESAIRDALAGNSGREALNLAIRALQSEAAKLRRRRPGDAALIDAQLAGSILAIATQLHQHKPARPAGCPRVPGPSHLLDAFEASFQRTTEEEGIQ